MIAPYLLMVVFFLALALLAALESALTSVALLPWFTGLTWLRAHFITIGILLEIAFGVLPFLAAQQDKKPSMRWDIWLALNIGMILLLIGIPLVNSALIVAGGTLVFTAALLLIHQLAGGRRQIRERMQASSGRKFYQAGLLYLLLGIFLGTGLWLGWGQAIGITNPKEVHVHANLWGFTSLLFAGLIIDLYADVSGRSLAWPRSIPAIFWSMTLGALGLVLGPWLQIELLTAGGLVIHTVGTLILLANMIQPLRGRKEPRSSGIGHLISAYIWFLLPVVVAPFIVANVDQLAVRNVEQSGAPVLVYGWILQFSYAIGPYLMARAFGIREKAVLGGNRLSLAAMHGGAIFYALSLFLGIYPQWLQAIAFTMWAISMVPILLSYWQMISSNTSRLTPERGAFQ